MKNKLHEIEKRELEEPQEKKISRSDAIKKTGYIALSAATMMILLGTPKTASASPAPPPSNPPSGSGHGPWKK